MSISECTLKGICSEENSVEVKIKICLETEFWRENSLSLSLFKDVIHLFDRQRSQAGRDAGRERGGSRLSVEQRAQCGARF